MNSPCEGGAKTGAAIFHAQALFHYCAHKLYAPEHPADYPANGFLCWGRDGKCLRSEVRKLNSPDRWTVQEMKGGASR